MQSIIQLMYTPKDGYFQLKEGSFETAKQYSKTPERGQSII